MSKPSELFSDERFSYNSMVTEGKFGRAVYLADWRHNLFVTERNVHFGLQFGKVYWQDTAIVNGVDYTGSCLGMHPPDRGFCYADFLVAAGARFFRSNIGLARQDTNPDSFGQCVFEVRFGTQLADLDNPKIKPFYQKNIAGPSDVHEVLLGSMEQFRFVRLGIYSGQTNWADHAVWCNPRFTE